MKKSTEKIKSFQQVNTAIFGGFKKMANSIQFLTIVHDSLENHYNNVEKEHIDNLIRLLHAEFQGLDMFTLNRLSKSNTFKRQIRAYMKTHDVEDPALFVAGLIQNVTEKQNEKIISAKRTMTKVNRTKEKRLVLQFYFNNRLHLVRAFALQKKLLELRDLLQNKLKQVDSKELLRVANRLAKKHLKEVYFEGTDAADNWLRTLTPGEKKRKYKKKNSIHNKGYVK